MRVGVLALRVQRNNWQAKSKVEEGRVAELLTQNAELVRLSDELRDRGAGTSCPFLIFSLSIFDGN